MAIVTKTLKPASIVSIQNLTPNNVTYLQDNPSSPDANNLVPANGATQVPIVELAFDPSNGTLTGTQTINVAFADSSYVGLHIEVLDGGVSKLTSSVAYGTQTHSWTFDASILADTTGTGVTIKVIGHLYNGLTIQSIKAVDWVANVDEVGAGGSQTITQPPISANLITPTELFPFNNSAWKNATGEARVSSVDGTQVKLRIEYSIDDPTLATGFVTESILINSGDKVSLILDQANIVENTVVFWRAMSSDGTYISQPTQIFSYTFEPNGNFSPATEWMQQGDTSVHQKVLDISEYQGTIDWLAVKNDGVNNVYLRTYGSDRTGTGDTAFVSNVSGALAQGIKTGGYFFAMPSVPLDLAQARQEADLFINKLQEGYGTGNYGDLIPILNIEDNTNNAPAGQSILDLSVEDMLQWCNEFRNYFETQTGRILGLFVGEQFVRDLRNNFNHDDATNAPVAGTSGNLLKDMPLWINGFAIYDRYKGYVMPVCGGWTKWDIFQYGDTREQAGIVELVDLNFGMPTEWFAPPKEITGLTATDNGADVTVTWNATTEEDVNKWDIYLDGTKVGTSTTDGSYTITGVSSGSSHIIEVRPIDDYGDDSLISVSISYAVGGTTFPTVSILNVTRTKISDEVGANKTNIHFIFDVDVTQYTVNVNGNSWDTGTVAHSGGAKTVANIASMTVGELATQTVQQISVVVAGYEIIAEIDWTELATEGQHRVNIYGKSTDGVWTNYDQQ